MKLIVDIGNTNSVYAILDGNNYVYKQRLSPNENIKNIINEISNYNLDFIAIASVVPKQTKFHIDAFQKHFKVTPFVVNHKNANVKLDVDNINEVGADRICNVKAALDIINSNCIILDFGTATTYDVINHKKQFIGGAIAPGIKVSALNLINKAAMLNETNLVFPEKYIGKNTKTNIQSGVMFSAIHSIEGMIKNIKLELNGNTDIILTGGFSQLISTKLNIKHKLIPNLTLDGINLIHKENINE
tara:strand:- start:55399 stop:56133 length:735 start_codon:yes stop_codon:yes gene_type:complete